MAKQTKRQQGAANRRVARIVAVPFTPYGRAVAGRLAAALGPEEHGDLVRATAGAAIERIHAARTKLEGVADVLAAGSSAERDEAERIRSICGALVDLAADVLIRSERVAGGVAA